jgi:short chain dehydrogenase
MARRGPGHYDTSPQRSYQLASHLRPSPPGRTVPGGLDRNTGAPTRPRNCHGPGVAGPAGHRGGASRGIGNAIAPELAWEGVDVAIVARNKTDLEATASQLGSETNQRILPRSDPMPTQLLRLFSSLGNNSSLSSGKVLAFEIPARGAASDARDELEDRHLESRG